MNFKPLLVTLGSLYLKLKLERRNKTLLFTIIQVNSI